MKLIEEVLQLLQFW